MRKKLAISLFLIVCIFSSAVFAADEKEKKITDLTPWKGHNVSMVNLYKETDGDRFFAAVHEHAPEGYTVQMVKDFFDKMFSQKFNSMEVVDGDTIIIDGNLKGDYAPVGKLITKWEKYEISWNIFKTDSEDLIAAGYKYFLLMPFHQHGEDSLRHSHLRYGNADFDYLATDPSMHGWWPTIYQPATTDEAKIMENMIKGAKKQASMLPKLKKNS